jgi:hypothetical protein
VSYLFLQVEFPNARPPKRETPAPKVGGSGHHAERDEGGVLKQEKCWDDVTGPFSCQVKKSWFKCERAATVIEGRWSRGKVHDGLALLSLNKSAKSCNLQRGPPNN